MIQDGEEDTESDDVKSWVGALEKYMLFDSDDFTQLYVEVDIQPEYIEMMNQGFEKVLALVKQLAEQQKSFLSTYLLQDKSIIFALKLINLCFQIQFQIYHQ